MGCLRMIFVWKTHFQGRDSAWHRTIILTHGCRCVSVDKIRNTLYESSEVMEAACWAHARRKFYDLHAARPLPMTQEALERIGGLVCH